LGLLLAKEEVLVDRSNFGVLNNINLLVYLGGRLRVVASLLLGVRRLPLARGLLGAGAVGLPGGLLLLMLLLLLVDHQILQLIISLQLVHER